jgi:predicted small metal-binding protein
MDALKKDGTGMTLQVDCAKVNPATGCTTVIQAETEEELMQKVAEHAKDHGITEVTPELIAQVKGTIEEV